MLENAKRPENPEKEHQMTKQKNRLFGEIETLENVIDKLMIRLDSITRKSFSEPTAKTESVEQELVPFAHEIRVQRRRIQLVNESLRDLLERIEI